MKLKQLFEAPLEDISLHQGEETGSFSANDIKLYYKYVKDNIYKKKLAKLPMKLYVYILNDAAVAEFGEMYPEGELDMRSEKFDVSGKRGIKRIDLTTKVFSQIFIKIKQHLKSDPKSCHLIMGDNYSLEGQVGLTPWIIAHRLVHCLSGIEQGTVNEYTIHEILTGSRQGGSYGKTREIIRSFYNFQSAKSDKLQRDEEGVELATQYLVTGKLSIDEERARAEMTKQKYSKATQDRCIESVKDQYAILAGKIEKQIKAGHLFQGKVFYI